MSKQTLVESSTEICFAALALASYGAALAPFAIPAGKLVGYFMDLRAQCDARQMAKSTEAAFKELERAGFSPADLDAARDCLQNRRHDLRLDPAKLAAAASKGEAGMLGEIYDQFIDPDLPKNSAPRRAIEIALTAAYRTCSLQDNFHKQFTQNMLIDLVHKFGSFEAKINAIAQNMATKSELDSMQKLLLEAIEASRPDEVAKYRDLAIALANTYAKPPDGTPVSDFDSALRNIEAALVGFAETQATLRAPSNAADHLDAVFARVSDLNQSGQIAGASDELARALQDQRAREAEQAAGMLRLLDLSIAQSRLQNQPDTAAALLLEKLQRDGGVNFFAIETLFWEWLNRGDQQGLNFDSAVAIALARAQLSHAKRPDLHAGALSNFGAALMSLGRREAGTDRLDKAFTVLTQADKAMKRGRNPLGWAAIQHNLGTALFELGERAAGTKRLKAAVAAFQDALQERKRERAPQGWAETQNSLGGALLALGQREAGTDSLHEAIKALRKALLEFTPTTNPRDWAGAQDNLGIALTELGRREESLQHFQAAVAAHDAALKVLARTDVPLAWAGTKNNLGTTLTEWGRLEGGVARLVAAVAAFDDALQERTAQRVPLHWASATGNRAVAQSLIADRTDDGPLARAALRDLEMAEPMLRAGAHIHFADYCARNLPAARAVVARLSGAVGQPD
jgi:tetratricopeptide (TPR) repeat protein